MYSVITFESLQKSWNQMENAFSSQLDPVRYFNVKAIKTGQIKPNVFQLFWILLDLIQTNILIYVKLIYIKNIITV